MQTAERHLLRLQGTGVGDAQTLSLRARRWFQLGDEDAAMAEVDMAALERLQTEHRPYALVIRVPARNEEALHALVARISQLFQDQPSLGFVDGTGTDGTVWEIFLDGDDPDRLWASVRPLLAPPDQWRDAEVTMRSGSDTVRFRLDS